MHMLAEPTDSSFLPRDGPSLRAVGSTAVLGAGGRWASGVAQCSNPVQHPIGDDSGLPLLQVAGGWSLQQRPICGEPGAMQRAVPGLLEIVEAHNAAEVGTDGRQGAGPAI